MTVISWANQRYQPTASRKHHQFPLETWFRIPETKHHRRRAVCNLLHLVRDSRIMILRAKKHIILYYVIWVAWKWCKFAKCTWLTRSVLSTVFYVKHVVTLLNYVALLLSSAQCLCSYSTFFSVEDDTTPTIPVQKQPIMMITEILCDVFDGLS